MIVLSEKVEDAEEFPLIRLDIERNKKAFNEAKITKHGKIVNEDERKIRSLSSDNVFITQIDPSSKSKYIDKNEVTFCEMLDAGYALGDRFKIVSYDIEPIEHLEELDFNYTRDIDKSYKNIDAKYEKIIKEEVKQAVASYEKELNKQAKERIDSYKKELVETVDLLIDGPFIEDKVDNKRVLLGSKNKNLSFISNRYKKDETYFNNHISIVEVTVEDYIFINGD